MSDAAALESSWQPVPFVIETLNSKALHFSNGAIQSRMRVDDPDALDLDYTRFMMGFRRKSGDLPAVWRTHSVARMTATIACSGAHMNAHLAQHSPSLRGT